MTGWLEPMLARIADNDTNVPVPVIESISDKTFEYMHGAGVSYVGGFTWDLLFTWIQAPRSTAGHRRSPVDPVRYGVRNVILNWHSL